MDGPHPTLTTVVRSEADPALPVGGAGMREPQDAASESNKQSPGTVHRR
jgi:hypothetical protein